MTRLVVVAGALALSLGCGESKKGEPEVTAPQNVVADPAGNPPTHGDVPSEVGAILKGKSGNVLADPKRDVPSDIDGEELDAAIAEVQYEAGKGHLEKREFKEAIAVLQRAVKSDPKHGRAFFAMGQAHNGLGLGLREVRLNKLSRLWAIATKSGLQKPVASLVTPFSRQEAKGAPLGRLGILTT